MIAVAPHATLSASPGHMTPVVADGGDIDNATPPCHDRTGPSPQPSDSRPSCCIIGCGLLGAPPTFDAIITGANWRVLQPDETQPLRFVVPEPAERPPRGGKPTL